MSRTVRDTNLETSAARLRLVSQRKPYWRLIESGLHLGYRRNRKGGGSWVGRRFIGDGHYAETKIGIADDLQRADGVAIKSFKQAQDAVRDWWRTEQRRELGHAPDRGPVTVAKALDAYFTEREHRGSKGLAKDKSAARIRIIPALGDIELSKLTVKQLRDWHTGLAKSAKLARSGRFVKKQNSKAIDQNDAEAVRARRATANRTLTILKAALNHAYHEGYVVTDDAWRKVKPFREVDAAVIRFLSENEILRFVNSCEGQFREIVRAALLTGCRYGELCRLSVADYNADAGTITVRQSKVSKPRHIALTDEGMAHLNKMISGLAGSELIFKRDDGGAWGPSHQQRHLLAASLRAKIDPPVTFNQLRHAYASSLAMKGSPMGVIAAQLGHADTRMTEKHYAHLAPNYVAETVRASLPNFGIVDLSNVETLALGKQTKSRR